MGLLALLPTEAQNVPLAYFAAVVALILNLCIAVQWRTSRQKRSLAADPDPYKTPPRVPHIIPWLGSAIPFKRDAVRFVKTWSEKLDSPVFSALIAGKTIVFLTDPFLAAHIVSGRVWQLSWRQSKIMLNKYGGGMFHDADVNFIATNKKGHAVFEGHMMKDSSLDGKMSDYQRVLWKKTIPRLLSSGGKANQDKWIKLNIMEFFGGAIWQTTAEAIFGVPALATSEDFDLALKWDSRFGPLVNTQSKWRQRYKNPEAFAAREALAKKMMALISEIDDGEWSNGAAPLATDLYLMFHGKIELENLCRHHLLLLFASILNTAPTVFWAMYHILADRDIYDAVAAEVMAIYEEGKNSDDTGNKDCNEDAPSDPIFSLSQLNEMSVLGSVINETLRLRTTEATFRFRRALKDVVLRLPPSGTDDIGWEFTVKKGTAVVTCPTLVHRDPEIFDEPLMFKWDRFLPRKEDGKPPVFSKGGRPLPRPVDPFGAGPSMCPARKFAVVEIKALVASMFVVYDMRFAGGKNTAVPEMQDTKSILSSGMPATDVAFEVRKRC